MAAHPGPRTPATFGGWELSALHELARRNGIATVYTDVLGREIKASDTALLRVLRLLDVEITTPADADQFLNTSPDEKPPPVVLAWDGILALSATATVQLENGGELSGSGAARLEFGVHQLIDGPHTSWVISAPRHAPVREDRTWGIFQPVHSMRTSTDWGTGDFTSLRDLHEWATSLGASTVGTLPLTAQFYDVPFDPSPYSPASRLFHNDLFVDPEASGHPPLGDAGMAILDSLDFKRAIAGLRRADHVDYKRAAKVKRRVLQAMSDHFFTQELPAAFRQFEASNPYLSDYAKLRATTEVNRAGWNAWETHDFVDADHPASRYHRFAQWMADTQLSAASQAGAGLYLDLPLGTHPDGFDTWRFPETFAIGAAGGAPPDTFFTGGQNWGFAPMHPQRIRSDGYAYFRACLKHLLRHASVLRIDHIMGLHRFYWIPDGLGARDGAFVKYESEELYAILCLEAHLANVPVVGEDLGTVAPEVHEGMDEHKLHRMFVVQYQAQPTDPPLSEPSALSLGCVNTHDMWPFAAWWKGTDIDDRVTLGLLHELEAKAERAKRAFQRKELGTFLEPCDGEDVLEAVLRWLATADSKIVVVNLEDLWGELRPQNVPGVAQYPSWTIKSALSLDQIRTDDNLKTLLHRFKKNPHQGQPMQHDQRGPGTARPVL